ncbi:MAG: PHP domain-containing protein [Oscillospiraceae bacterium]|nr:PHP domain-containing protein [Oscillospiraceae bacterium]
MIGDLHCHTTLSDGSLGIEEVIVQAKRMNLDYLSITDHDTLSSSSRAAVLGDRYGVKVIPGVELSAWDKVRNSRVHILCYAPQKPDRLEGLCLKSCEIRKSCARDMIEKVIEKYPITSEAVLKYCKGSKSIYKQHIMRALVNYGYATELYGELDDELFNREHGSCIVTREYPDVNFVIDLIHSSRGVAIMAHPYLFNNIDLLRELAEKGKIDGIEVNHNSANEEERKVLLDIAKEYDLIVTGGSDFHGLYNAVPSHIGSETTDAENIQKLIAMISANAKK